MARLTTRFVQTAPPGKHGDGDGTGLMLVVQPSGSRSFVQRLMIHGKQRDIGIGSVRWTTLTEARRTARKNQRLARRGGDPLALRAGRHVPTFAEAADKVIAIHAAGWRDGGKSEKQWRASIRDYAMPRLGRMRVDQIGPQDVMTVLLPIWSEKRETARRVRQRIGAVMKWAVAEGHRPDNPAGDAIGAALPKNGVHRAHHRALPHAEVGAALETIRQSQAWPSTRLALEFIALTAARSGEVRAAQWSEIDEAAATWTVPADRMKAGREYRVSLCSRAMAILSEARALSDGAPDALVFPSQRGRALSDATLGKLMKDRGIDAVPHGFRSSFRAWCGESGIAREVAEAALAHVVKDKAEAAYARSDLFDRRREVMTRWAEYIGR